MRLHKKAEAQHYGWKQFIQYINWLLLLVESLDFWRIGAVLTTGPSLHMVSVTTDASGGGFLQLASK